MHAVIQAPNGPIALGTRVRSHDFGAQHDRLGREPCYIEGVVVEQLGTYLRQSVSILVDTQVWDGEVREDTQQRVGCVVNPPENGLSGIGGATNGLQILAEGEITLEGVDEDRVSIQVDGWDVAHIERHAGSHQLDAGSFDHLVANIATALLR